MPTEDANRKPAHPGPGGFATTRWSVVLAAGQRASPDSQAAVAALCESYWYPLYAFVRRRGHGVEDAQDLTQEFFARLLEKGYLRVADRERGKFRSFLLSSFKHFLANESDRAKAQKRGGGCQTISLDFETGESRYNLEPSHELTPERIYERRWALTLIDQVLVRLRQEFVQAGKQKSFDLLKVFLTGEKGPRPYSEVATELGMTEGAFKVAVHRLRRRFRELLQAEIAQTVAGPDDMEDELRHLFEAISSKTP